MIHIFLGTKAQLIKMAPIMKGLQEKNIEYNFVFSGQHKETIDDLRKNFGIKEPDITLYKGTDITSVPKMLVWCIKLFFFTLKNKKRVWKSDKDGVVLNHGDTFSTLLGTFLAKISGLKAAHIESGLRSFNLFHPFPEELTRLAVFKLSDYYFAPDEWSLSNLEKYKGVKVNTKGNSLYDALQLIKQFPAPADIDIPDYKYAVVSLHRFENLYKRDHLENIVELLEQVASKIPLLFILHKPTLNKLNETGLIKRLQDNKQIDCRPRYDYLRFISLVNKSEFVITDGGSNQEECSYLGKPCLLFRNATERQEGLDSNAVLSEFATDKIHSFVDNYEQYKKSETILENTPSSIIIEHLINYK